MEENKNAETQDEKILMPEHSDDSEEEVVDQIDQDLLDFQRKKSTPKFTLEVVGHEDEDDKVLLEVDNFGDLTDEVAGRHFGLLRSGIEDGIKRRVMKILSNEYNMDGSPKAKSPQSMSPK